MPPHAVVVTGASTGIGRATVLELVSAGFQVLQDDHPPPRQVVGREAKVTAVLARLLPYRVLYGPTARARAR